MENDGRTPIHARGVYQNGAWRAACGARPNSGFIAFGNEQVTCRACRARRGLTDAAPDAAYFYANADAQQGVGDGLALDGAAEFAAQAGLAVVEALGAVVSGVARAVKAVVEWLLDW